jgi:flagellar basal body rod protein FlgC
MRAIPGASNATSTEVTLLPIAEEDQPRGFEFGHALANEGTTTSRYDLTIAADAMRPAVQVAKGTEGAQVQFDIKSDGDQQIQILTREGVHLAGTSSISIAEANTLMSIDSGFGEGGYSSTYLNQTGTAAYLDSGIRFGAVGKAQELTQLTVDPSTGVKSEVTVQSLAQINSKPVAPTNNASGAPTTLVAAGAINFNHTYYDPSDTTADAEGYVNASIALEALSLANNETVSAAFMANYFNDQFDALDNANVVATAETKVFSGVVDPTKSLSINGTSITYAANAKMNEMIQAINAVSGQTAVRAEWNTDNALVLTNTAGNEGENIVIGGDPVTALGIVPGTYSGTYELSAAGEEVLSNAFASDTESLNGGAGFALTLTRADGSVTTINIANGDDTPDGIVAAINDDVTGIAGINATLVADGTNYRISLNDQTGVGNGFTVSTDIATYNLDTNGDADLDLGFNDLNNRNTGLNKPIELSLTLSGTGNPADLGRLGFATGVIFDGPVADDLAIFVTGSGSVNTTLRADAASAKASSGYPADTFVVSFTSNSVYTITDTTTNTVVATRTYTAGDDIAYQGIRVEFDDTPKQGDTFTIEANTDGVGNNENMLRLITLSKEPMIAGQTFSAAYRDLVAGTGSRAHLAELSRDAMEVVRDQAQASREAAVGVNLDEEAADLIRFQQAYQAAAQVIQISQRMFDTLIQAS